LKIIISPAKKMNLDIDSLPYEALPQFLSDTQTILHTMQSMNDTELKALWRCNDAIAALNCERMRRMNLHGSLTPALLSYEGIQYRYMAPGVLEYQQLAYLREHLRILSGFYGLLRPFDGVTPYRLELQAKLSVEECRDLYAFWGDRLARQLASETEFVLNLASKEYSRAVLPHLPKSVRVCTCTFAEQKEGKVLEKGTLCKMARGEMVRWLAENAVTSPDDIKEFDRLGYQFCKEFSMDDHMVFLKKEETKDDGGW